MMARLDGRLHEVDWVSKWVLAIVVIPGLLLASYAALTTVREAESTQTRLIEILPARSHETLKALAVATGHPCDKVCAVAAITGTRLKLTCAIDEIADDCAYTRAYTLTVDYAPEPSR
jgi:hypothetical protein